MILAIIIIIILFIHFFKNHKNNILFTFLILILSIYFLCYCDSNLYELESFTNNKKNIWLYWENKKNTEKPEYLNICYKTIIKNCSKNFNVNLLNEKTVYDFLPNLRADIFKKLNIPQRADYIRLKLLNKYGGIWLDSDIIVLKDLSLITDKLNNYDFVGFGCHYKNCSKTGYPKPANWVMCSRINSKLMNKCIINADLLLDIYDREFFRKNYHILGRKLLWKNISLLKSEGWDYYHFDSKCIDRDSKLKKITNERLISNEDIDKGCINNILFIPVYNTAPGFPKWFLNMNYNDHLRSNTLFSKFIKFALFK